MKVRIEKRDGRRVRGGEWKKRKRIVWNQKKRNCIGAEKEEKKYGSRKCGKE